MPTVFDKIVDLDIIRLEMIAKLVFGTFGEALFEAIIWKLALVYRPRYRSDTWPRSDGLVDSGGDYVQTPPA